MQEGVIRNSLASSVAGPNTSLEETRTSCSANGIAPSALTREETLVATGSRVVGPTEVLHASAIASLH